MSAVESPRRSRLTRKSQLFIIFVLLTVFICGVLVGANLMSIRDAVVTGVGAILPILGQIMTGGRR